MKRRVLAILLCVAISVTMLAGCGASQTSSTNATTESSVANATATAVQQAASGQRTPRSGEKFKIGMSMISIIIPFYVTIRNTVEKICKEKGWDLVVLDANGDSNKQIGDMEDLVTQGCDVILCNSYDTKILVDTINNIRDEDKVPVVAIDNALDGAAKVLTCVQADNYGNGFLVGKWVVDQMKGKKIKAALLSGQMGTINSLDRRDGLLAGIAEEQLAKEGKSNLEIIAQGYCDNWSEDNAVKAMEDMLALNEDFNVLLSEADVMTMAGMKVMQEANKLNGKIIAAAADGQKEAFAMIKEGTYGATGTNSPSKIGEYAMKVCEQWFAGANFGDFPAFTYTPAACVTKDNVDKYYDPNSTF